jgi:hypothetical protein
VLLEEVSIGRERGAVEDDAGARKRRALRIDRADAEPGTTLAAERRRRARGCGEAIGDARRGRGGADGSQGPFAESVARGLGQEQAPVVVLDLGADPAELEGDLLAAGGHGAGQDVDHLDA